MPQLTSAAISDRSRKRHPQACRQRIVLSLCSTPSLEGVRPALGSITGDPCPHESGPLPACGRSQPSAIEQSREQRPQAQRQRVVPRPRRHLKPERSCPALDAVTGSPRLSSKPAIGDVAAEVARDRLTKATSTSQAHCRQLAPPRPHPEQLKVAVSRSTRPLAAGASARNCSAVVF